MQPSRGLRLLIAALGAIGLMPAADADAASTSEVPRARDVVTAAFESLGDDAPIAVVVAYDGGYSLTQVVDALAAKALASNGAVVATGATVKPQNPPALVITPGTVPAAAGPGRARRASEATEPDLSYDGVLEALGRVEQKAAKQKPPRRLRAFAREEDIPLANLYTLIALIGAMQQGYSSEQIIVDGLLDERIRLLEGFGGIVDESRKLVRPAGQPDVTAIGDQFFDDLIALGKGKATALATRPSGTGTGTAKGAGKPVGNHFAFSVTATLTFTGGGNTGTFAVTGVGEMSGGARVLGEATGHAEGGGDCYDGNYQLSVPMRFDASADRDGSTLRLLIEPRPQDNTTSGSGLCARQAGSTAIAGLIADYPEVTVAAKRGASSTATGTAGGVLSQTVTVTLSAA